MCSWCLAAIGCILDCSLIIANIIFYFSFYYRYNYENKPFIYEIEKSFNGKIINSFSFKKSCETVEVKLILGQWDGINNGCD